MKTGGSVESGSVKDVGKPGAGKPHARFDEGGLETERPSWAAEPAERRRGQRQTIIATAPVLYSTCVLKAHVDLPVKVRSEEGPSHLCSTAAIVWGDLGDEARGKALFWRVSKPPVRNIK